MARGIYGAGMSGMSGSINRTLGGWTFGKNGLIRKRVIPIQPNTSEQARVKAFISAGSTYWGSTLDTTQRESWITAASSGEWPFPDKLTGTPRNVSGFQLFMALNGNLAYRNQDSAVLVDEVPVKEAIGTAFVTSVNAETDGTVELTYSGALSANEIAVIAMSAPQSPGRMSFRASKLTYVAALSSATPWVATAGYLARHGALTGLVDYNIFYEVAAINTVTGQKSIVGRGVVQVVSS